MYKKFQVVTQTGQIKYIEIMNGSLENLDLRADMLICSAFQNDYIPTRTSLIGCLYRNFGISVAELAGKPAMNLRDLGVWISGPLEREDFKRIACVEMRSGFLDFSMPVFDFQSMFDTLFFAIGKGAKLGYEVKHVALPILGTGNQGLSVQEIIHPLATECIHALNTIPKLEKITFFERDAAKYEEICSHLEGLLRQFAPITAFISYSHQDLLLANKIAVSLEQNGIKAWIDHKKIRNPDYAEEIVKAIQAASVFLILISQSSQKSVNVKRELYNAALYEEKEQLRIYPVLLEQIPYCEAFSYYLQGHDYSDISVPPVEEKIERLCLHLSGYSK